MAGGAGHGLIQWPHIRTRIASSTTWIASTATGFATLALGVGLAAGVPPGNAAPLGMLDMSIILGARSQAMMMRDASAPDDQRAASA